MAGRTLSFLGLWAKDNPSTGPKLSLDGLLLVGLLPRKYNPTSLHRLAFLRPNFYQQISPSHITIL